MIAGPEQAKLLKVFEQEFILIEGTYCIMKVLHSKTFQEQAQNLVQAISEMGNPFLDVTLELLVLDTRNVIDESVYTTVQTMEALGKK